MIISNEIIIAEESGSQNDNIGIHIVDEGISIYKEWYREVPLIAFDAVISGDSLIVAAVENKLYRFDRSDDDQTVIYKEGPYIEKLKVHYKTKDVMALGINEVTKTSIVCLIDPTLKANMECSSSDSQYIKDLNNLVITRNDLIWMRQYGTSLIKMKQGVKEIVSGDWGKIVVSNNGRIFAGEMLDDNMDITEIQIIDIQNSRISIMADVKTGEHLFGVDDMGKVYLGKEAGCKDSGSQGYLDLSDGIVEGKRRRLVEGDVTLIAISNNDIIMIYRKDEGSVVAELHYAN
jgi:hypothetical protein